MGGKFVWPTLEECKTYRVKCRELVNEIIDRTELVLPITPQSPWVYKIKFYDTILAIFNSILKNLI